MFGFFHRLKLQNSFPPAVTTHSLCHKITSGGEILQTSRWMEETVANWQAIMKRQKGFPRFLYFLLCKICKCVASKHVSKQKPDVLESRKPPTELSNKLSSAPGHPIWCCCLTVMVNWPLHSFRLNISILCEGILCFIAMIFFCLASCASTRKNRCPG